MYATTPTQARMLRDPTTTVIPSPRRAPELLAAVCGAHIGAAVTTRQGDAGTVTDLGTVDGTPAVLLDDAGWVCLADLIPAGA